MLGFIRSIERSSRHFVKGRILSRGKYRKTSNHLLNFDWPLAGEAAKADRLAWNGFPDGGESQLRSLAGSGRASPATKAFCHWSLSRLRHHQARYVECLEHLEQIEALGFELDLAAPYRALLLDTTDRAFGADAAIGRAKEWTYNDVTDCAWLAIRGSLPSQHSGVADETEANGLSDLNTAYSESGLAPLRRRAIERPISIDNLTSDLDADVLEGPIKFSVIMPAFNCEETLEFAVDGLLSQTYGNYEVLIVDDASTDQTHDIAQQLAKQDRRVTVLRHDDNRGAYAARNSGLAHATGTHVTVHDPDDWSHPQLLERLSDATIDEERIAFAMCLLVGPTLRPLLRSEIADARVPAAPSLVYRRDKLVSLGGWLGTRIGSDTELQERYGAVGRPICAVAHGVPMSFQLMQADSLTNASATSLGTLRYGLRRELIEAQRRWHIVSAGDLSRLHSSQAPVLPAPHLVAEMRNKPKLSPQIVHIADLASNLAASEVYQTMWDTLDDEGWTQALYHWPQSEHADRPKGSNIQDCLNEGRYRQLVPGEEASCELLIVHNSDLLADPPADLPTIVPEKVLVIVEGLPRRPGLVDKLAKGLALIEEMTSKDAVLAPGWPAMRSFLTDQIGTERMTRQNWNPVALIRAPHGSRQQAHLTQHPALGRIGMEDANGWPTTRRGIRQAGLAGTDYAFRVLDGEIFLSQRLRSVPENWTLETEPKPDVAAFMQQIDIYTECESERFDLDTIAAPVLAMACGVPVILPPSLEPEFGRAADYAHRWQLKSKVEAIWGSPQKYQEQSQAGLDFVHRNCNPSAFRSRLEELGVFRRQ